MNNKKFEMRYLKEKDKHRIKPLFNPHKYLNKEEKQALLKKLKKRAKN